MGKRLVLILVVLLHSSCAPPPAPKVVSVRDLSKPRFLMLPSSMHDQDYVCDNPNYISTCATVGEVRAFLLSRKVQP